jgi:uncharacterized protein (TIGR03083 family)
MDVPTHIDALRVDGARLAAAAALVGPDAPVPTCPEWAVRDLVHHQGAVHRWATAYVSRGLTEPGAVNFAEARGPLPDDADLVDWFVTGHAALVAALAGADPDMRCWSFLPSPSPLAFWARRQAHEISIHRVDAELAAGGPLSPVDPAFAADGIDELLVGFAPLRGAPGDDTAARTVIAVRCSDEDAGWMLRIGPDSVTTTALAPGAGDEDAGCTVRGPAEDVYLTLWRRAAPDRLAVEGDRAALGSLLEQVRI